MSTIQSFILIDDDPFNNVICSMVIEQSIGKADIKSFEVAEEGLLHIGNFNKDHEPAILFLDINMPGMTGWEFLERFEKFGDHIKEKISIYILSSSIDERDKDKATFSKYISGFISKPLRQQTVFTIAGISQQSVSVF